MRQIVTRNCSCFVFTSLGSNDFSCCFCCYCCSPPDTFGTLFHFTKVKKFLPTFLLSCFVYFSSLLFLFLLWLGLKTIHSAHIASTTMTNEVVSKGGCDRNKGRVPLITTFLLCTFSIKWKTIINFPHLKREFSF